MIVGVTGGIGSGKSTVCRFFELLGAPVYNADTEAKNLLDTHLQIKQSVVSTMGDFILDQDGKIDRKKLAELVFNNKENLEKLNSIIHPAVGAHFKEWVKQHTTASYVIKEAAVLFESGAYKQVDKIITVVAPPELKIKRVMHRDKITREQIIQRINTQLSDEEKMSRSQFVVVNDELQLVIPQLLQIHAALSMSS